MTPRGRTHRSRTMARSRKHNPTIPAHIDQRALPKGVYWDSSGNGRWYILVQRNGKPARKTIAGRDAKLSDLHAMMESPGTPQRGTVEWLCDAFRSSPQFADLSPLTRRDYDYCRGVVVSLPTNAGLP